MQVKNKRKQRPHNNNNKSQRNKRTKNIRLILLVSRIVSNKIRDQYIRDNPFRNKLSFLFFFSRLNKLITLTFLLSSLLFIFLHFSSPAKVINSSKRVYNKCMNIRRYKSNIVSQTKNHFPGFFNIEQYRQSKKYI